MHKFKVTQIIEVVVVALNIYLMLDCSQVFAELKTEDILGGDQLNPSKNINRKRKQTLFASLPISRSFCFYFNSKGRKIRRRRADRVDSGLLLLDFDRGSTLLQLHL